MRPRTLNGKTFTDPFSYGYYRMYLSLTDPKEKEKRRMAKRREELAARKRRGYNL